MLARLGVLLRLAFPVELALAFTAGIFLLGFVAAMSAGTALSPARTQPAAIAPTTTAPAAATAASAATVTGESAAPAAPATTAATVTMGAQGASFIFAPATLTIHAGTTVTWKNTSTAPHTVVGSGFDSGVLMPGQSFTHTFTQTGTVAYTCTIHPGMAATIQVVP
jgi:plastocyanin